VAINKLLMLKRDPKDNLRSWAERFERYSGRPIEQKDLINVGYPTWSLATDWIDFLTYNRARIKEECDKIELWCRDNLSMTEYCIWYRDGAVLLAFETDDTLALFKLIHSGDYQINKDKVTKLA
jgi:hypothetical protein